MGSINYRKIYEKNQDEWKALTREPQKYEALLAGHYSDSNHFVYELLQNAEDEKASTVVIEFYKDRLVFYHDGEPFDESDVIGVSSMLMGTKDRNDAQTIGRFGMGFKSVFKYTDQPEIYSDHEAFVIKNYLLPEELEADWDYQSNKKTLIYPDKEMAEGFYPFADSEHLSRIIIPFYKRNAHGEKEYVNGADVLQKLKSLTGEILMFLTWIKDLYWINKETKEYAHITKDQVEDDPNLITCRISSLFHSEEISRYLKYKRIFEHPEMSSAEVSVAYRVNPQVRNVLEIEDSPVWVYFPTREDTSLPFLIHGSFETAVSREKLMTDSHFNRDLFDQLGDLIAESMLDLAERKLITQNFLRRIIIPAFQDESSRHTIGGLKEKITAVFKKECIFPDRRGKYRRTSELAIPVPFTLADFKETALFAHSFDNSPHFVAFNHERERNFTEYFVWMYADLNIPLFTLDRWAEELCKVPANRPIYEHELEDLQAFYHFLSDETKDRFQLLDMDQTKIREIDKLHDSINENILSMKTSTDSLMILKEQEVQAQMLSLQSQMNPHFLYNSLSTIGEMAQEGLTEPVSRMCDMITEIMRYISSNREQRSSLEEELEICDMYLDCLQMRYQDHLTWTIDVEDDMLDIMIPKLCIQLLVENAVRSITTQAPPWHVSIICTQDEREWRVTVSDNGPGFDPEVDRRLRAQMDQILADGILPSLKIQGMGLLNIFIRLYLLDGIPFVFDMGNRPEGGAFVTIGGILSKKHNEPENDQ